jgi:hypothetical protein
MGLVKKVADPDERKRSTSNVERPTSNENMDSCNRRRSDDGKILPTYSTLDVERSPFVCSYGNLSIANRMIKADGTAGFAVDSGSPVSVWRCL